MSREARVVPLAPVVAAVSKSLAAFDDDDRRWLSIADALLLDDTVVWQLFAQLPTGESAPASSSSASSSQSTTAAHGSTRTADNNLSRSSSNSNQM